MMVPFPVHRPRINEALESQLSAFRIAGYLEVRKPPRAPRPTKEQMRIQEREKRIAQQVEALLAEMLDEPTHLDVVDLPSTTRVYVRDGVDYGLEERADQFLASGRRENRDSDPRDWLTREQLALRRAKETYSPNGMPDSRLVRGIYRRAFNPLAGQRPKGRQQGDE